ncbi:MAG: chromosomal replication initiator protein DnaA [Bryobacterales bacterium]|nr:chromosomal replication initiator protein DnaA [Bryobacterales bacterium]
MQKNTWDSIKDRLHGKVSSEVFQNWFARTSFVAENGLQLRVAVPDESTKYFLESEYAGKVQSAISDLSLPVREVRYELSSRTMPAPAPEPSGDGQVVFSQAPQLNCRLTFESFVVGSCNQFAHAAARAVSANPSRSYNPLFIYGGSGMGKTHLIHAIGIALRAKYGQVRIVYTTGERFMNEMIQCIRGDRMPLFHQHYRTADVLLIDDVHTLGGKERTQEEFFHTFNELHDHQKQIVVTSDSLPKHIPNLVERLRSRFEWGLMVDVQPPDLETKMAILDRKSEEEGHHLPEDVRIYLATKTKSNVRELHGVLVKLLAYSSVTGSPITLAMAQQLLKPLLPTHERRVTIDAIIRTVAEKYGLQPAQLKQKTNAHEISRPRQVAMYLAKELTSASLPEIGRAFGNKHHTTVLHSLRKVEELRHEDPDLNKLIHNVVESFH